MFTYDRYVLAHEIEQNVLDVLANTNLNHFKSGRNRQSTQKNPPRVI
jgi:hypothetical protein